MGRIDQKSNVSISEEQQAAAIEGVKKMVVPEHNIIFSRCAGSGKPPQRVEFGEVSPSLGVASVFGLYVNTQNFKIGIPVVGMQCGSCNALWATPASNPGKLAKLL